MTNRKRKRIFAIHILDEPPADIEHGPDDRAVYVYRKTRNEEGSSRLYVTRRGDALAEWMTAAGAETMPFIQGDWEIPPAGAPLPDEPTMVYNIVGVKFEIPGRFDGLWTFDAPRPVSGAVYTRLK